MTVVDIGGGKYVNPLQVSFVIIEERKVLLSPRKKSEWRVVFCMAASEIVESRFCSSRAKAERLLKQVFKGV